MLQDSFEKMSVSHVFVLELSTMPPHLTHLVADDGGHDYFSKMYTFYMTLFVCCNDYMSFMFYTTFREHPVQGRIQGEGVKSTPSPYLGNPKIS